MSASRNLKGLLAGVAAVAVIGTAMAQGNPPNPAKKDAATGAGQQSSQQTPMGTTGTPGGSTASGTTSSTTTGSTGTGSTSSSSNMGTASSGSTASGTSMGSGSTASGTSGTSRPTRTARADRN